MYHEICRFMVRSQKLLANKRMFVVVLFFRDGLKWFGSGYEKMASQKSVDNIIKIDFILISYF